MSEPMVPAALLLAVSKDLRPVRPLSAPGWRALLFLPLAVLLLVGEPALWGWRQNIAALGAGLSWGLSVVQALAGVVIVGLALREAIPGRELSHRAVGASLAMAFIVFAAVTLATQAAVPTSIPARVAVRFAWECFGMAAVSSLPTLALAAWLASRALPTRPAMTGALCGLGAGLMADAGVRLFCWVSTPTHVFVSHGGAIVALVLAGIFTFVAFDRTAGAQSSASDSPHSFR